jgi:cytochrome c biogenesis protein CcmG, thiol:disulfide interchange protein DsbE
MRRRVSVFAVAALAGLIGCGEEGIPRGPVVGSPSPEYSATALDGASASLADHQGRLVLLNVWATWCPPCREEIPALQELHERFVDRGLDVVGVSIDGRGERDNIRDFLDGFGVTYPIWLDPSERVTSVFRTQGVPTTFLIARNGTLLWRHVGPVTADHAELNRLLDEHL